MILFATLGFFVVFALLLGLGTVLGGKSIRGSCGGLNTGECEFCFPKEKKDCRKSGIGI